MDSKTHTLGECLSKTGLRDLPKALAEGENKIWINAIVLVNKGGIEEYCLANNDGLGKPSIIQDFGVCRAISRIISIHPIECVSGKYMPDLRSNKAIITFLGKNGHNENAIANLLDKDGKTDAQIEADKSIVRTYINQAAIKIARKEMAERERCRAIRTFAENARAKKNGKEENNG